MRRFAAALVVISSVLVAVGGQVGTDQSIAAIEGPQTGREGELVTLSLEDAMKKLGVPGLSVAVIRDFEIQWTRAYGVADVGSGATVTPDTLFQAASISKPVTAMAILKRPRYRNQ